MKTYPTKNNVLAISSYLFSFKFLVLIWEPVSLNKLLNDRTDYLYFAIFLFKFCNTAYTMPSFYKQ